MQESNDQNSLRKLFTREAGSSSSKTPTAPPSFSASRGVQFRDWISVDPRALAIFRITYGILLVVDVLRRLPYVTLMYSRDGVLPNKVISDYPFSSDIFSILLSFDGPIETRIFFYFALICAFMFTIGWKTRLFQFLSAACLFSLHQRNILVENGGDQVMNIFMMWGLFLPLGKRLSVDALLRSLRENRETTVDTLNDRSVGEPERNPVWNVVMFACLCQLAAIYFFNTVSKNGPTWTGGTALYYILHMDRQITEFAVWSRMHVPYGVTVLLTYATLVVEGLAPALVLSPIGVTWCRRLAIVSLCGLHIGIALWMNVGLFSWAMICAYPLLLTKPDMDALKALGKRFFTGGPLGTLLLRKPLSTLSVSIRESSSRQLAVARILKRLDRFENLKFTAGDSWSVQRDSKTYGGLRGWGQIVGALPFGFIILTLLLSFALVPVAIVMDEPIAELVGYESSGFVPYMDWPQYLAIMTGLYVFLRLFAQFQHNWALRLFSAIFPDETGTKEDLTPRFSVRQPRSRLFWTGFVLAQVLAIFLMFIATRQMVSTNDYFKDVMEERPRQYSFASKLLRYPRMFNKWNMFAPNPPKGEGWIIIDGCTVDGRNIDIQTGQPPHFAPVSFDRGVDWGQMWRIYTKRIAKKSHKKRRPALRDWLKGLHRTNPALADMRLKEFDVYWMRTQAPKPEDWYKPIPEDHWSRQLVRWWMLGDGSADTRSLKGKGAEEIQRLRKTRQVEKKVSSMFWREPRIASGLDEELYDTTERLKPRKTCYKVTSYHPKAGRRMSCKKGEQKSTVPEVCLKKEKDPKAKRGRGKTDDAKRSTTRPKVPKARPARGEKSETSGQRPARFDRLPKKLPLSRPSEFRPPPGINQERGKRPVTRPTR